PGDEGQDPVDVGVAVGVVAPQQVPVVGQRRLRVDPHDVVLDPDRHGAADVVELQAQLVEHRQHDPRVLDRAQPHVEHEAVAVHRLHQTAQVWLTFEQGHGPAGALGAAGTTGASGGPGASGAP